MITFLDFEKPVAELEAKIAELKAMGAGDSDMKLDEEIKRLEDKVDTTLKSAYSKLTPWQKTQVARHPLRPHLKDYVDALMEEFTPLAGDRGFGDDDAILGGPARFNGQSIMLIGHEKGSNTESRIKHNFGMARPEGYRKAIRLMQMADRFNLPVVTLVDTPGAYPGVGAEERGQAEAIARSTQACLDLGVPMISIIVGEGGSGGAVALAAGNRVLMMEHSVYSVISPEGCASILWRTADKAKDAATALKITAQDLKQLGVIDEIISEPVGGAHRDPQVAMKNVGDVIDKHLSELRGQSADALRDSRAEKFLALSPAASA